MQSHILIDFYNAFELAWFQFQYNNKQDFDEVIVIIEIK